jgi:hypothetical protein
VYKKKRLSLTLQKQFPSIFLWGRKFHLTDRQYYPFWKTRFSDSYLVPKIYLRDWAKKLVKHIPKEIFFCQSLASWEPFFSPFVSCFLEQNNWGGHLETVYHWPQKENSRLFSKRKIFRGKKLLHKEKRFLKFFFKGFFPFTSLGWKKN